MKRRLALLAFLVLPLAAAEPADLNQIRAVYILPMGNGLDQYLANRITAMQLYLVVADPKQADAVLTDQLGATFERKLDDLYAPEPVIEATEKKDETTEPATQSKPAEIGFQNPSWGRGKGNVFLVSVRTRVVLWSIYERPKDTTPDQLNRTAGRIANRLKDALTKK